MTLSDRPNESARKRPASSLGRIALLTAYLWSSAFMFSVQAPLTNSETLAIYGSDVAALLILAAGAYLLLTNRPSLTPALKRFAVLYAAFFLYCVVVVVVRELNGPSDLTSLLVPRVNFFSSLILLLIVMSRIGVRDLVIVAYAFSSTLAIAAVPLAISDLYIGNLHLPSAIFESLAIRTDLQMFLMPILLFGLLRRASLQLGASVNWLFALNLGSLVFCSAVTGARVNSVLVPAILVTTGVAALLGSEKGRASRFWGSFATPLVVSLALVLAIAPHNTKVEYGLERNSLYAITADHFAPMLAVIGLPTETSEGVVSEAGPSKEASTAVRGEIWPRAWEEYTGNVWFGTGLHQYDVTYSLETERTRTIFPHNFALEYLMAFGVVGLVWWFALILYWPLQSVRNLQALRRTGVLLLGLTLTLVFATSFFQPLMLNAQILVTFYFVLGSFAKIASRDQSMERGPAAAL